MIVNEGRRTSPCRGVVDRAIQPRAGRQTKGEFRFRHCEFTVTAVQASMRSQRLLGTREMPILEMSRHGPWEEPKP